MDGESEGSWVAEGDSIEGDTTKVASSITDKYGNFEGDEPRARRYSFPLSPTRQKNLPNADVFGLQLDDIKKANKDFLIDNVYAEARRVLDPFAQQKKKTVSRRTQTYLRELL